jgi:NADH:ubiquinone oxidoreductase subunit 2 (subunit N)
MLMNKIYLIYFLFILAIITIYTSIVEGLLDNHIGRIIGQSSMINMSFVFITLICMVIIEEVFLFFIFMSYVIPTLLLFCLLCLRDVMLDKRNLTIMYDLFIVNNYILIVSYLTLVSLSGLPFLAGFVGK